MFIYDHPIIIDDFFHADEFFFNNKSISNFIVIYGLIISK